jgi:hypothetical protein
VEIFFFWFIFAIVVGVVASSRGRSGFGWFLLAMVISPLLGIILVALLPSLKDAPNSDTHAKCAMCAEPILKEAIKCKHCGHVHTQSAADTERAARVNPPVVTVEAPRHKASSSAYDVGRRFGEKFKSRPSE